MDVVFRNNTLSNNNPNNIIGGTTPAARNVIASTRTAVLISGANARDNVVQGNSIGTDRRFLAIYLPEIEEYLHYRSVDVSSVKELVRRWYPSVRASRPKKVGLHRALDDIRESVAELRYYREHVFVPPADVADATAPE